MDKLLKPSSGEKGWGVRGGVASGVGDRWRTDWRLLLELVFKPSEASDKCHNHWSTPPPIGSWLFLFILTISGAVTHACLGVTCLMSCVWAHFLIGFNTMPGQRHSQPTPSWSINTWTTSKPRAMHVQPSQYAITNQIYEAALAVHPNHSLCERQKHAAHDGPINNGGPWW